MVVENLKIIANITKRRKIEKTNKQRLKIIIK